MKYRILIKNYTNTNVTNLSWFFGKAGNDPWETENKQEALDTYQELLNSHSHESLTLIQVIPVAVSVSAD